MLYDIGQSFDRYPTALGNGLCPAGATPVWAPWWVEGARDEFQPINMASLSSSSLTTKQKNKEQDRNDNYYDRWFVIQGVDDDKPLSKMSPFAVDKALKCAVETVKSIKCLRSGDLLVEVSNLAACSFPTFLLGP